MQRQGKCADFCGFVNGCKVDPLKGYGHDIGTKKTHDDRNNFDHALAPDIADNYQPQGNESQQPVGRSALNGCGGKNQTNGNNDRTGDHRREETHDAIGAIKFYEAGQNKIEQAGDHNTAARVRKHLQIWLITREHRRNRRVATDKGEG